ncbi:MAG: C39 family peptidase [Richelia sp. CSU_2_1]|nr:C39 family peptidase [Richelia sp. CSU_2_1]
MQLTTLVPTVLKLRPLQSSDLAAGEKWSLDSGETLDCIGYQAERNKHWKIVLAKPRSDRSTWFAFQDHVALELDPSDRPETVKLNVPFKSQLDNEFNPRGSCNVTSIAMCLAMLGVQDKPGDGLEQLEDELYDYMERKGLSRHSPEDLARVVRDYGKKDDFTVWGTFERCKDHLAAGNPCVIHGYFTSFGHIIALVGYDDTGFIVHDPYGEWFSSGYRTDLSGEFLHYSYDLIQRTCIPDGQFWVHYISS